MPFMSSVPRPQMKPSRMIPPKGIYVPGLLVDWHNIHVIQEQQGFFGRIATFQTYNEIGLAAGPAVEKFRRQAVAFQLKAPQRTERQRPYRRAD